MEKIDQKCRILLQLKALDAEPTSIVNIWNIQTGARALHLSYRPWNRTLVINDYQDMIWGQEIVLPLNSASELKLSLSILSSKCLLIESNICDPFCFIGRVPFDTDTGLEMEYNEHFNGVVMPLAPGEDPDDPSGAASGPARMTLQPGSDKVLIVGSAPSVADHLDRIKTFDGDVWALNDALFWLTENGCKVDALFVNDGRFIRKRQAELNALPDLEIVVLDTVDLSPIAKAHPDVHRLKVLGREGYSDTLGTAYHGCSVFITAIQCAAAMKYRHVDIAGVMFPPSLHYARVDGTRTLPEYVYPYQISAARFAMSALRRKVVQVQTYEPNSNLLFL